MVGIDFSAKLLASLAKSFEVDLTNLKDNILLAVASILSFIKDCSKLLLNIIGCLSFKPLIA